MPTQATVLFHSCLLLDDHGYLVTLALGATAIFRFYPNNLRTIDQPPSSIFSSSPNNIAYYSGAYYVGFDTYILVVDSSNMSQVSQISTNVLSTTRDMIFLNGGQLMIVDSWGNSRLVFFNRSSPVFHNYSVIDYQTLGCQRPFGMFHVNDTFFYLTSQRDNTVYGYSNAGNITWWSETLILNASSIATSTYNGRHVSLDNTGR